VTAGIVIMIGSDAAIAIGTTTGNNCFPL